MAGISIVLPVYNAETFLDHCLEMLASQTYEDFEIIAVNDGSTDRSQEILDAWTARENRLRVIKQENQGPGSARNAGMDQAEGEYIIFLDPDDAFSPDFLFHMHASATKLHADIVICASSILDAESNEAFLEDWTLRKDLLPNKEVFSGFEVADDLFRITIGWPWDKLINLKFLQSTGLRYPNIKNSEDGALIFPALCLAKRIAVVKTPLVQHTMNRSSSLSNSRKNNALCFFDALRIVKCILNEHDAYNTFERGYLNWALNFCLWNLDTAHQDDKQAICDFIRNEGFDELRIFDHPQSFYFVPREYQSAKLIMQYRYPECMIIANLQYQLEDLKASRALHLGETLAGPLRKISEIKRKRARRATRLD